MKYYLSPRQEFSRRMARHQGHRPMNVHIPLNIEVVEDDFVITALVPGIPVEQIEIEVIEDRVNISGYFPETEDVEYLLKEMPSGKFSRSLRLPTILDSKTATAEVKDGVLTLQVSKAEEAKAKLVKIKAK